MTNKTLLLWLIIGTIWNSINLWLLFLIVKAILSWHKNNNRRRGRIILSLFLFLKFPLLYTAGYLILIYGNPSIGGLVSGFSLPLLIAFLWVMGRLMRSASSASEMSLRGTKATKQSPLSPPF